MDALLCIYGKLMFLAHFEVATVGQPTENLTKKATVAIYLDHSGESIYMHYTGP